MKVVWAIAGLMVVWGAVARADHTDRRCLVASTEARPDICLFSADLAETGGRTVLAIPSLSCALDDLACRKELMRRLDEQFDARNKLKALLKLKAHLKVKARIQ